jgi:hypothetical protein
MGQARDLLGYEWLWWLAAPLLTTLLASVWVWWRGRPRRSASSRQTIARHRSYLDALGRPPRGDRPRR